MASSWFWLITLVALSTSAQANLKDAMVMLDKQYIPALSLVREQSPHASQAVSRLLDSWWQFKRQYGYNMPADLAWNFDMDRLEWLIQSTQRQVEQDELVAAYASLLQVRERFAVIRQRYQMEYFPDELARYDLLVESIVISVRDLANRQLSEHARMKLLNLTMRAEREWSRLKVTVINPYDYHLQEYQYQYLQQALESESRALSELRKALKQGDDKEIVQAVKAIQPPLSRGYMVFGDFSASPRLATHP
ncbi:MAG: hypothetical protein HUJ30_04675 [Gammaproteobacteria bacterium]|nr:hypothetical protein [Gammaproteobacteria bacterium]